MSEYKAGIDQLKLCMKEQLKGTQFEQHHTSLEDLLDHFLNLTGENSQERQGPSVSITRDRVTFAPATTYIPSFTRIVKHIRGGGNNKSPPVGK
jgi:hypothetical protein